MADQPCKTCPFLEENFGKENPNGWNSDSDGERDWFTESTQRELVEDIKRGNGAMICHSTDPDAERYGGDESIQEGNESLCVGYETLLQRHLQLFELCCDLRGQHPYSFYQEVCSVMQADAWTEEHLLANAMRMISAKIPNPDLDNPVCVQWEDGVLNKPFSSIREVAEIIA